MSRFVPLPGDLGGGWGRQVLKIYIYHAPYKFFSIFGKGDPKVPGVGKKKFKYTKSGVTSFDVDADHGGMWTEDASRELADYIGPYLEQKR